MAARLCWLSIGIVLRLGLACTEGESVRLPPPAEAAAPETAWVEIGSELFELELALDPVRRTRGLSGRSRVPPRGGMLFAFPRARLLTFVMRDCWVPIDIAFVDDAGRIVAIHEMQVEPPRAAGEDALHYERRLRPYPSGTPVRFALEVAGGRLAEVGAQVGQEVVFDREAIARRAR